jgi:hypothetical protein
VTLEGYLQHRRSWEVSLWAGLLLVSTLANAWVTAIDAARNDIVLGHWEPLAWEVTSNLVEGMLIPAILLFDRRFPIGLGTWRRNLSAHTLFTVVFSLTHVGAMYWLRVLTYDWIGGTSGYYWPHWWREFGYEYLKDFRTYFFFVALIYLYRFVLRRWRGEAEFLSEVGDETETQPITDRFLIKKLGREFLVRSDHIDRIEAAGNYVNLYVGKHVYPLRETMTGICARLAERGFQRVHRSAIVNLDRVAEIVTYDSGDGEVRLDSDVRVPLSRRYRKELRERLR